jgi:hypothetical protein
MKLLLIQPPFEDYYDTEVRLQPMSLAYLKSAVRKYIPSVQAKVVDFHHGWRRKTVSYPEELGYLRNFYPNR